MDRKGYIAALVGVLVAFIMFVALVPDHLVEALLGLILFNVLWLYQKVDAMTEKSDEEKKNKE